MESGEPVDIISAASRRSMSSSGDTILVAVSGGPDSVALLHALHTRSHELGITLHVAHLNHGIRGEASDLDAEFVRDLAHQFGLPVTIEKADVPALREQMKLGEEEAARKARHEFLNRTADAIGANKIALGHTADDRAESVLLNILRGSGIDGLGSILPTRGRIVRPLIDTWRSEIEAYIKEHALPFRVDESNTDTSYTRNRVRHDLIPLLEQAYNPQVKSALVRLAEVAAAQADLVDSLASQAISSIGLLDSLDAGLLAQLQPALQCQVVRSEIERLKGDLTDVSFEQVERVIDALRTGDDFDITLPSGELYAVREGAKFRITRKSVESIEPFDIPLAIPGGTTIPQIALTITADEIAPEAAKTPPHTLLLNADAIAGALRVRNARAGDRITPFGMTGTKKLQDIFVDAKISRQDRARAAVVVDDERVLWVVGIVASEAVRITPQTRRAIRLVAERD